ncbi:MAG TPA: nuclear transport factor 2 family protein [Nevskia sp.]|nr:nuclear transport factor 2 family protein [Nevskia sp.]
MATVADLEKRLQALEDIHAIQELKARYLRACDRKQPDTMRDCFIEKGAVIEADGFPSFNDRDGWVAVFTDLAVKNPNVMDMHHGQNPQITLTGPDSATGVWDLNFCQINVKERTVVNLAGEYRDEYVRQNGRWWISAQRFRQTSFQMRLVGEDGQEKVMALGKPPSTGFIENA